MFNIGDSVTVNWSGWRDEVGVIIGQDGEFWRVKMPSHTAPGGFSSPRLALVDDSKSFIPEDWS